MTAAGERAWTGLVARLPSGELLVPGTWSQPPSRLHCPGPDSRGSCPLALAGVEVPCAGAEWLYFAGAPEPAWRCVPARVGAACPAATLDPLGPLPTPAD